MPRHTRRASPSGGASLSFAATPAGRWHGGVTHGDVSTAGFARSHGGTVPGIVRAHGPKSHDNIPRDVALLSDAARYMADAWFDSLDRETRRYIQTGRR